MWDSLPGRRQSGFADAGSALTTVLMAVVVVSALYFGREVLVPIALAVLMSFVLAPAVRLLQRILLPGSSPILPPKISSALASTRLPRHYCGMRKGARPVTARQA